MMRVVCGWCKEELGHREGPDGETTHGICPLCKRQQEASYRYAYQWVPGMVSLMGLLLLFGLVGEQDYQDKLRAARYAPGPSAESLAAVGLDWPAPSAQVGSQPQHGVHAAKGFFVAADTGAGVGFDRRVSPSWPSGLFSAGAGR